jgi:hypothetical protein
MGERLLYIRVRGSVTGPFSLEQLRQFRDQGQLRAGHEISEDRTTWSRAENLPEIFPTGREPITEPRAVEWTDPINVNPPPVRAARARTPDAPLTSAAGDLGGGARRRVLRPPVLVTGAAVILGLIAISSAGRHMYLNDKLEKEIHIKSRELSEKQHDLEIKEQALQRQNKGLIESGLQVARFEQEIKERVKAVSTDEERIRKGFGELDQRRADLTAKEQAFARLNAKEKELERREQGLQAKIEELNKVRDDILKKETKVQGEQNRPAQDPEKMLADAGLALKDYRRSIDQAKASEAIKSRTELVDICETIRKKYPNTPHSESADRIMKQLREIDKE